MTIYVSSGRNHASLWTKLQNYLDPIQTSCHCCAAAVPNQIQSIVFRRKTIEGIRFGTAVARQQHDFLIEPKSPQSNKGCVNNLYFWSRLQIIKHSFAHLEALLFLFVKVLHEFRLLSSTSQKHVRG